MKKTLLFAFLFSGLLTATAQDKKWSVELNYPISVGDDFGASNQGLIGAGLKYRFTTAGKFNIGASIDASWFSTTTTNDTDPVQELDFRDFFMQPRIFAELPITSNNKLKFTGGLGWSWYRSTGEAIIFPEGRVEAEFWNNGPNLNLGLSYDIASRWFVLAQYDLIFSSGDAPRREIGLIKVGAGFRF